MSFDSDTSRRSFLTAAGGAAAAAMAGCLDSGGSGGNAVPRYAHHPQRPAGGLVRERWGPGWYGGRRSARDRSGFSQRVEGSDGVGEGRTDPNRAGRPGQDRPGRARLGRDASGWRGSDGSADRPTAATLTGRAGSTRSRSGRRPQRRSVVLGSEYDFIPGRHAGAAAAPGPTPGAGGLVLRFCALG